MKSALAVFSVGCFASMLVVACTSSSKSDGSLTICRNLPLDSACSVNLAYLSCTYRDDAGHEQTEACLSDNINQCPDGTGLGGCTDQCRPGAEYAAVCVGPTDSNTPPIAPPSPGCHSLESDVNIYCCPCGS